MSPKTGQSGPSTCADGVLFHDGSTLDANDVVATWHASADCSSPNHTGRGEGFAIYLSIFQQFINADQC